MEKKNARNHFCVKAGNRSSCLLYVLNFYPKGMKIGNRLPNFLLCLMKLMKGRRHCS